MLKLHRPLSRTFVAWGVSIAAAGGLTPLALAQQTTDLITKDNIIEGSMDIEYRTRTSKDATGDLKDGSPAVGAKDSYKFNLNVVETTNFSGEILRSPNLYTKVLQRRKQSAMLEYKVDLNVMNPKDLKQKKSVGKWVGTIPIDETTGAYDLAAGSDGERKLRFDVLATGKASAFVDLFSGRLMGKAEKKDDLASYTYKRLVAGKEVAITVKKSDPMRFEQIILAKGPSENYPRTTVNGRLDYDYETGNWFTDGIKLRYTLDGKDYEDIITGSIKWVEDPDRKANGKGFYEFNLRFNEEKHKASSTEASAFEKLSTEDAFFAVDNSIPCLTGKITYADTFIPGKDLPSMSKVTYSLNANKVTKQQVMAFFKLWLIGVGPTNDE